jgi:hypothetical protein
MSCQRGRTSVVKLLVANPRVDPSAARPLSLAGVFMTGHVDMVKLLLAHFNTDLRPLE